MPTPEQLRSEAAWRAQFVPANLLKLADDIRRLFKLDNDDVGHYGDYRHLSGYHRSRRWILESKYCTNDDYSVTETAGNRTGGDSNWISGLDIGGTEALVRTIHARLTLARVDGKIPHILQVRLERSPWHVHVSVNRAHANDDHSRLLRIITGTAPGETDKVTISIDVPVLKLESQGLDVATIQGLLNARGYDVKIDGDFGPYTEKATRAMQKAFGAEHIDGIWGPETWTIAVTRKDTR